MTGFLERELTNLENDFIRRVKSDITSKQTDLIALVSSLDFFAELQELGLTKIVDLLQTDYADYVKKIKQSRVQGIGSFSVSDLDVIVGLDANYLLGSAHAFADQFKSILIKDLLAGLPTNDIVQDLENIHLSSVQLVSALNTSQSQFRAITLAKLFEDDETTTYKLKGVLDKRTRCQCRAVLLNQPKEGWTKTEIDTGEATKIAKLYCPKFTGDYSFVNRGGFNCRHDWEVYFAD